jgi:hypothetical protein
MVVGMDGNVSIEPVSVVICSEWRWLVITDGYLLLCFNAVGLKVHVSLLGIK